jgi:hypothetical protein
MLCLFFKGIRELAAKLLGWSDILFFLQECFLLQCVGTGHDPSVQYKYADGLFLQKRKI